MEPEEIPEEDIVSPAALKRWSHSPVEYHTDSVQETGSGTVHRASPFPVQSLFNNKIAMW